MDSLLDSVGIGFIVMSFFGTVLGFISFMRYLRYKETIELAKQGLLHPRHNNSRRGTNRMSSTMRGGVVVFAIGAALTLGLLTLGPGPWLIPGLIPLAIGSGLIYIGRSEQHSSSSYDEDDNDPIPPHKMS